MNPAHPEKPSFKKRLILMLVLVVILVGGLVGFNLFKVSMIQSHLAGMKNPPQTVTMQVAQTTQWNPQIQAIGSLRALHGVDLSPEVPGTVRSIAVPSGAMVHAGQLLLQMVDDAERAQVSAWEASVKLARITLQRDRSQLEIKAVSQAQLDADQADLDNKLAQWNLATAQLAKKSLNAPFAGRVGITTTNPGQYLNPGDKVITLQQLDPLWLDFTLPQEQVGDLAVGQKVSIQVDAWPEKRFEGKITALNPLVDASTRNIQVLAQIGNPAQILLPGMYAKVFWSHGKTQSWITLPQSAITYNPYGATVFILQPNPAAAAASPAGSTGDKAAMPIAPWTAQQVFVTTGPTRGDQVAILSGLQAGARVVTSGQLKLKSGIPVMVSPDAAPANDAAPTPQEH